MAQGTGVGARGEAVIQSGDREVRVLFTNRVLAEAERRLGKSILAIVQGFSDGALGMNDVVTLLVSGMQAARREGGGGPAVTLESAYEVMDEAGFAVCTAAVMESVAAVLSYEGSAQDPNA